MILGQKIIIISMGLFSSFVFLLILFKTKTSKFFEDKNLIKYEKIMTALCILCILCTIVNPSLLIINMGLSIMLVILSCKIVIRFLIDKSNKIYCITLSILFFISLVMKFITPI